MPDTGAVACGTGAQGNVFASGLAWANPTRITTDDASSATVTIGTVSGVKSNSLEATNFGFALPAGSTVTGIVAEWKQMQGVHFGTGCFDSTVNLIKTGAVIGGGTNQATNTELSGVLTFRVYGASNDAWALSLTETDTNNATFGVDFIATNNDADATASVDYCRMTVYYTTAGAVNPTPQVRIAQQVFDIRMFIE